MWVNAIQEGFETNGVSVVKYIVYICEVLKRINFKIFQ